MDEGTDPEIQTHQEAEQEEPKQEEAEHQPEQPEQQPTQQPEDISPSSAELYVELGAMKLRPLKKYAEKLSVDQDALDNADDKDDIVKLIVQTLEEQAAHEEAQRVALKEELEGMKIGALLSYSEELGIHEDALDDAAGKAEMIALIVKHQSCTSREAPVDDVSAPVDDGSASVDVDPPQATNADADVGTDAEDVPMQNTAPAAPPPPPTTPNLAPGLARHVQGSAPPLAPSPEDDIDIMAQIRAGIQLRATPERNSVFSESPLVSAIMTRRECLDASDVSGVSDASGWSVDDALGDITNNDL
eukprot:COSAG06_NODE_10313_length_1704_cov_3.662784_1_plen_303_part_00